MCNGRISPLICYQLFTTLCLKFLFHGIKFDYISYAEEAENVLVFGSSRKTVQEEPIGMYGNGLKSGSMRMGKDMILFTKQNGVLTCLMISRTFYQAENVTQVTYSSV